MVNSPVLKLPITTRLLPELHRRVKTYAAKHNEKLEDVIARAIQEFLDNRKASKA